MTNVSSPAPGDDRDLRDRLRILTTALHGVLPPSGPVSQVKVSSATTTFIHLARLLNDTGQYDVAVTGAAGYPRSQVILVTSDSAAGEDEPTLQEDCYSECDIKAVAISEADWEKARIPKGMKIGPRVLAETLLWTLQELKALSGEEREEFTSRACTWFLRATWGRYRGRVMFTMDDEWKTLPTTSMVNWQLAPGDEDVLSGLQNQELIITTRHEAYFESFSRKVARGETVIVFLANEAPLWAGLISDMLRTCRNAISKADQSEQPPGFHTSAALVPLLAVLLSFPPVKAIFTRTSLGKAFERRHKLEEAPKVSKEKGAKKAPESDTEDDTANETRELLRDVVDDELDEKDKASAHLVHRGGLLVFRFLETLVASHNAFLYLAEAGVKLGDDVRIKLVTLAPPRPHDVEIREELLADVRNGLKKELALTRDNDTTLKDAKDWIDDHFTDGVVYVDSNGEEHIRNLASFSGNVHAEAGLMALSYLPQTDLMTLHGQGATLPIGVSKKCCWTCWQLRSLLKSNDSHPKFELPGSHGSIYAWNPPEFGIPSTVLRNIHDTLFCLAKRAALEAAEERKSQASSPASKASHLHSAQLKRVAHTPLVSVSS